MGLESAKLFVKKMKEDNIFREQVNRITNRQEFWELVKKNNFSFEEQHLAGAMAACMTEMEDSAI